MRTFITEIKEDEISPYIVCMSRIIRPMDGTTFNTGDSVKVVFINKDDPAYPVGLPGAEEFTQNKQYGTEYEMWLSAGIYTTESQRMSNPSGYPKEYSVFKDMTLDQKRIQAKQRANSIYHGYSKTANTTYTTSHGKVLKEFQALKPDPGVDLMKPFNDGYISTLDTVDTICDTMGPAMAQMLGINLDDLRALNQAEKQEFIESMKHHQPIYAGDPPMKGMILKGSSGAPSDPPKSEPDKPKKRDKWGGGSIRV